MTGLETSRLFPGFVDAHSHDDTALLSDPVRAVKRDQGIVHQVIGNCGLTPFPLMPGEAPEYEKFLHSVLGECPCRDDGIHENAREFVAKMPANVSCLLGYNSLRVRLFGYLDRPLDSTERMAAQRGIADALDAGAIGVSIGLAYLPAVAADAQEIAALAEVAPLLTVHMRNESTRVIESLDEMGSAVASARSRGSRCHLHISHLKIAGEANWPLWDRLLARVLHWREELGITFDHYPFSFGSTGLAALLPPEFSRLSHKELARVEPSEIEARFVDADWENYIHFAGPENLLFADLTFWPHLNGTSLEGQNAAELIRDMVVSEPNPAILIKGQSDAIIDELLKLPFGCIGSDALPDVKEHPRLTRTFPEYLARMKRLGRSLDFAVEKASLLPRRIFGIANDATVKIDAESYALAESFAIRAASRSPDRYAPWTLAG